MNRRVNVAIAGATGAVGAEFIGLLEKRGWNVGRLELLASARSAGKTLSAFGSDHTVKDLSTFDPSGIDVALFSAGSGPSREMANRFMGAGSVVVDNSSAFRMHENVPLVVPEINPDYIKDTDLLIANPNCCTIILLMALHPLRKLGSLKKVVVSTYQSASGAGAAAMEELVEQTKDVLGGKDAMPRIFQHQIAFNLFNHNTAVGENGYNDEENKVIKETRKIFDAPTLNVNPTCVRVPILRAHSESVTVTFEGVAPTEDAVRNALAHAPGVVVVDDRKGNTFPMPISASGRDEVFVGRIRRDPDDDRTISMFVCGDQLLKGAALNAVQIAELVIETRKLGVSAEPAVTK